MPRSPVRTSPAPGWPASSRCASAPRATRSPRSRPRATTRSTSSSSTPTRPANAEYLAAALELSRPGTLIVADNVIRSGAVLDGDDASAVGVRRFFDLIAAEPRLRATAIQTVGEKGYDGFALAVVL